MVKREALHSLWGGEKKGTTKQKMDKAGMRNNERESTDAKRAWNAQHALPEKIFWERGRLHYRLDRGQKRKMTPLPRGGHWNRSQPE